MDIDEWRASVFGALSPVAITLLPLHRFGINLLDLFPYGSFRDGLYANNVPDLAFGDYQFGKILFSRNYAI